MLSCESAIVFLVECGPNAESGWPCKGGYAAPVAAEKTQVKTRSWTTKRTAAAARIPVCSNRLLAWERKNLAAVALESKAGPSVARQSALPAVAAGVAGLSELWGRLGSQTEEARGLGCLCLVIQDVQKPGGLNSFLAAMLSEIRSGVACFCRISKAGRSWWPSGIPANALIPAGTSWGSVIPGTIMTS